MSTTTMNSCHQWTACVPPRKNRTKDICYEYCLIISIITLIVLSDLGTDSIVSTNRNPWNKQDVLKNREPWGRVTKLDQGSIQGKFVTPGMRSGWTEMIRRQDRFRNTDYLVEYLIVACFCLAKRPQSRSERENELLLLLHLRFMVKTVQISKYLFVNKTEINY